MTASLYTPSAEFPTYADYRRAKQREARRAWKERNAAAYAGSENRRRQRKYAEDSEYAQKQKARALRNYREDPAKGVDRVRKYRAANKQKTNAYFREYNWIKRRRVIQATPKWSDLTAIREIYRATRAAGLEVDHVVPIAGKNVCGLHVPNNLQMLSRSENASKGNSYAD